MAWGLTRRARLQDALNDRPADAECRVRTQEQIADCRAPTVSDPALRQMVRPILQHVAALTERAQIL